MAARPAGVRRSAGSPGRGGPVDWRCTPLCLALPLWCAAVEGVHGLLLVMGLAVVAVELVYLRDFLGGDWYRMNTLSSVPPGCSGVAARM